MSDTVTASTVEDTQREALAQARRRLAAACNAAFETYRRECAAITRAYRARSAPAYRDRPAERDDA